MAVPPRVLESILSTSRLVAAADGLDASSIRVGLVGLMVLIGLAVLAWGNTRVRGTTLLAVWFWSVVSVLAIGGAEIPIGLAHGETPPGWATALRFAAAMSTFCPTMALLGAKRPQDRGWQFIVASLWAILALPAFEWLLFGGIQEIHPARFWFLATLISVGALNAVATRFWPSSLLCCLGQAALVAPYFPAAQQFVPAAARPWLGLALIVTAWGLQTAGLPRAACASTPLDRLWRDFRDAFGAVWSLRVAERINASAAMYDWPVMLGWRGFRRRAKHDEGEAVPPSVEESVRTLLRRFVSPAWIDARLDQAPSEDREPTHAQRG